MTRENGTGLLLERDDELAVVGRALRDASSGVGQVIVIAGPLGNGKTTLLRALRHHPEAASFTVLQAAASPVERGFAYGIVRQLLEPVIAGEAHDAWDGVAALARPVFAMTHLAGEPLSDDEVDHAVRRNLVSLGRKVTIDKPLLVLVDDLQWVDDQSLRMLDVLAQWIGYMPAVLVVTVREGNPLADRTAVAALMAKAAHRLQPRPLTREGSAALLRSRLGQECEPQFASACHEATGGNPMLLTSLAQAWSAGGQAPVAAAAAAVRTMRPVQARDRLVAGMRTLSAAAQDLLKAMVVLAEPGDALAAGTLAGLDELGAAEATRALNKLGLLVGNAFAHTGVSDAVEELMTAAEWEDLHARAVRLLYDNGRPVEQVANQLLRITAPSGPWAVEVLRVAADNALRGGSPEIAARYLRRALLDTSVDGEDRAKVLIDLATAERGFDPHAAVRRMSYTVMLLTEPRDRAAAAIRLTPTVLGDAPEAVGSLLRDIADELGDPAHLSGVDRELALGIEARLRYMGMTNALELDRALTRLAALGQNAPMTTGAERELLAVLLHCAMVTTRKPATEVTALAEHLLAHEPAWAPHPSSAALLLVTTLAAADTSDRKADWLDQALAAARRSGDTEAQALIHGEQSLVHLLSGRSREATSAAADAFTLAGLDWRSNGPFGALLGGALALQLPYESRVDEVLADIPPALRSGDAGATAIIGLFRGSSAMLRGDLPAAAASLIDYGVWLDRRGWRNPVIFPWRTSLALIRQQLGETDEAITLAEEERLIAEEWGAPSGIGRALRVLGALVGGSRGIDLTCRAVEVLESSVNRLELATALLQWADMSARADVWRRCLDVAEEIGADDIAARARAALGNAGSPVSITRLTPSERRVALLAAAGCSNQEIAEMLEVTSRAIEKHLTNTYRKLGVRKRSELAEVLRDAMSQQGDR